ncbi:class I SAM-dependent methyltransferase [Winogradskyella maritima]|uniref:Class I SAM-dependent methyltransferase n=1 Tax=Winogradskyella maritima TaxID=1517766 RepID=A0ABV8AHF4_9FLAO|nr:class I SAM-dependent methyltransferase [Winogradskyella maritima]
MNTSKENTDHNRAHYNKVYKDVRIDNILNKMSRVNDFLDEAASTDTSWVCMYKENFREYLKGKKVLELGCGDCTNAAVMSALGANVWANDISDESGQIIEKLNKNLPDNKKINFISGNFLETDLASNFFDVVVGKAFVHHLTHAQEKKFIEKIVTILRPEGLVRFVEPAINSKILDTLRWMVPMDNRPSSLQKRKFKIWKELDPHPERENSGKHYQQIGAIYFEYVNIYSVGMIERFYRFFPSAKWSRRFRKKALAFERYLPKSLRDVFARTQTIEYVFPKKVQ